ncbi:TPA: replication/maintenance protein RepL [Pasteurella multocida]|nr:replication/maintenance protein RepL [Pasteurella multocida]HDX1044214.1 replication/maintenance protein RepL [Pasteurella multocida]HDX1053385.1 replication/maintenance protein RepL [Pasteurella multocida]HDX1065106.1 replication/maintenance protein RepL [Pasteurella multocida]HDX1069658.1 replication/maintenance protein RepL [Pasteurella multocida]
MAKEKTVSSSTGVVSITNKKRLVDLETGEEFESYAIVKEIGDNGFKKVFLGEILGIIDEVSNSKMKFLIWLLDSIDKKNQIIGTYESFSQKSGISRETIARLIPILIKANVIKRPMPSVYMLNPDIVAGVSSNRRANLLIQYKSLDKDSEESAEKAE